MRTLIKNGHLLDTKTMEMSEEQALVIEDGLITTIGEKPRGHIDLTFDAKGSFVLPGFIDAHVHFRLASMDFRRLTKWSEVEYGIVMARLARETLLRGFTTVRDVGGDVSGLQRAIKSGEAQGPRIISAGRFISQTGGHGDVEGGVRAVPDCACQMRHTAFGIVADGVDAVRKAARHNLREGSDFLKIHVSGGVATPSDPLDSVQ
jgi:imidazolonepropionase-like amidohydrolase